MNHEAPASASSPISRRRMLARLGLLALGAAPFGPALAAATPAGRLQFVVANDLHFRDERCRVWLEKVVAAMKTHRPAFCVINGDLSEDGREDQLLAVREIFSRLDCPVYVTIGNHDCLTDTDRTPFLKIFPGQLNHWFGHGGWQFVALDSTQGEHVYGTRVQPETFAWLDARLPSLDREKPTILFTHFPMGHNVLCRPLNAPELLARFDALNLRATFGGHWHGYAERHYRAATQTNSRCCSWWRHNNDKSPEKGYFLCEATPAGEVRRQFCVLAG